MLLLYYCCTICEKVKSNFFKGEQVLVKRRTAHYCMDYHF